MVVAEANTTAVAVGKAPPKAASGAPRASAGPTVTSHRAAIGAAALAGGSLGDCLGAARHYAKQLFFTRGPMSSLHAHTDVVAVNLKGVTVKSRSCLDYSASCTTSASSCTKAVGIGSQTAGVGGPRDRGVWIVCGCEVVRKRRWRALRVPASFQVLCRCCRAVFTLPHVLTKIGKVRSLGRRTAACPLVVSRSLIALPSLDFRDLSHAGDCCPQQVAQDAARLCVVCTDAGFEPSLDAVNDVSPHSPCVTWSTPRLGRSKLVEALGALCSDLLQSSRRVLPQRGSLWQCRSYQVFS